MKRALQIQVCRAGCARQLGGYRGGSLRKIGQEECLIQRKIKNCKSRCRKPSRRRIFDSGKSKNVNLAVENQAGTRFLTAENQKDTYLAVMKWDFVETGHRKSKKC